MTIPLSLIKMNYEVTMCVQKVNDLWNGHHDESGISEHHSCLPELRTLVGEPLMYQLQTAGIWLCLRDPRTSKPARTTESRNGGRLDIFCECKCKATLL